MTPRILLLLGLAIPTSSTLALPVPKKPTTTPSSIPEFTPVFAPASVFVALDDRLPFTKLKRAVHIPNLCNYRYHVGTRSAECQKFIDQALGYYYSYVWIEAARSAETALLHDPSCAFAWLVLHKGLEKWNQGDNIAALKKAQEFMPKASHREQMLITARLNEKGLLGTATADERKKRAAKSLDELLTIYDDDEEAWFARAALAGGFQGGPVEGVPYYKALLKVNPLHPGANHELVHYFEGSQRPALGWPHAEGYVASSPGIPHALHMQSHLAMRIGKWELTTDRSARAVELQLEYHRVQGVKPNQDHQYSHHLETLTLSLVHDGRFREVGEIRKICEGHGYRFNLPWFRTALGQKDWPTAEALIAQQKKSDKAMGSYMSALMSLERNDLSRANAEVDVLRQIQQTKRADKRLENRLLEVQGRTLCAGGSGAEGIKLLQRVVDRTKNDYWHHAWGGGAYYMETWGIGALDAGDAATAEEAFLEALAHDAGSAIAAFGMEALCQRVGRTKEAGTFANLANRLWSKADPKDLSEMRAAMARRAEHISLGTTAVTGTTR